MTGPPVASGSRDVKRRSDHGTGKSAARTRHAHFPTPRGNAGMVRSIGETPPKRRYGAMTGRELLLESCCYDAAALSYWWPQRTTKKIYVCELVAASLPQTHTHTQTHTNTHKHTEPARIDRVPTSMTSSMPGIGGLRTNVPMVGRERGRSAMLGFCLKNGENGPTVCLGSWFS